MYNTKVVMLCCKYGSVTIHCMDNDIHDVDSVVLADAVKK
jgi:hypothetical protein